MRASGRPLDDWTPPPRLGRFTLDGRHVQIEPLIPAHAPALHAANRTDDTNWD